MKRLLLTIAAALLCTVASEAAERVIDKSALPQNAMDFVATHFKNDKVVAATEERCYFIFTYEYNTILASGTKIEFDSNGEWREVECIVGRRVPSSVIPPKIARYIQENFPKGQVMKIERDKLHIDVELNNKVELKFNHDGELLEIDI